MKSYTDLEQSKKLAKFLPIESADMRYGYIAPYDYSDRMFDGGYDEVPYPKDFLKRNPNFSENEYDGELSAWSLAALLDILPNKIIVLGTTYSIDLYFRDKNWFITYKCNNEELVGIYSNNLVDIAFEMICWLFENNYIKK